MHSQHVMGCNSSVGNSATIDHESNNLTTIIIQSTSLGMLVYTDNKHLPVSPHLKNPTPDDRKNNYSPLPQQIIILYCMHIEGGRGEELKDKTFTTLLTCLNLLYTCKLGVGTSNA